MAKALMIQGTMSNVGKSMITAGLCRIFSQDGLKTAPFKAQNMALNSFITADGLEIGRAQAMQAQAAKIQPEAAMNPILLKPTADMTSQVIVNGISIGNMSARDYFSYKKELIPVVKEAYQKLDEEYEIIVIEGAGSPAEINLKQDDLVNMGMAKMADAAVLLVGDIDRGGVFAQLFGTVNLLDEEEKKCIKGLIINKFRGDRAILEPGIDQLKDLCHLPVMGVVPYLDICLDDEDSLSSFLENKREKTAEQGEIDIAVIRFPRIANFTDFTVFSCIPGVSLRYVSRVSELGNPDFLLLPGTKNTIEDLLWMRQNGLEAAILHLADHQIPIWGICGGYQMMGEWLEDSCKAENKEKQSISGMNLLPVCTEFALDKKRSQVEGAFSQVEGIFEELSGKSFAGYEMHMGKTEINRENGAADTARIVRDRLEICRPLSYLLPVQHTSKKMNAEGWSRGNIYGCYIHGIFDQEGIAETIVNALRQKKGLPKIDGQPADYFSCQEQQYDQLADALRKSLDIEGIYQLLGLKLESSDRNVPQKMEQKNILYPEKRSCSALPGEIETLSFAMIDQELKERKIDLLPGTEQIVKRAIHTTADFDYADNLIFSPQAVQKGIEALRRGAVIVTDTMMAKAGINKQKANKLSAVVSCFMADADIAEAAKKNNHTRASASMDKAVRLFGKGERPVIFVIGNAPTALLCLLEQIEKKEIRPALIIGVPVGFVHVVDAKEKLIKRTDVPYIAAKGRKGGSNVGAAILNALFIQALEEQPKRKN